jgi:Domain of unknown function (DUF4180)
VSFVVWSEPISSVDDALRFVEVAYERSTRAFLLEGHLLPAEFFELRSRFAGEFVQKLVNYQLRVAAVFPPDASRSERFAEFVAELARHPSFRSFAERAEAEAWLASG